MKSLFQIYCIDTSSLILLKDVYPRDIFPSVWEKVENVIMKGYVIAPREVLRELEKQEDELLQWARRLNFFRDPDSNQLQVVKDIMKRFPRLVDPYKTTADADPFVIALAKGEGCTVITEEIPADLTNPSSKPKIPNVCNELKVKWIPLQEFFREQKWKF